MIDIERRIAELDWTRIGADLDARGCAPTGALLTPAECAALAGRYDDKAAFRSRIVMARHGFGRGEYKYFSYPLPDVVAALRTALYARLAPVANRWAERLRSDERYPEEHAAYLRQCHAAGQTRPTPLLLKYGPDDYNCLHQDLYGELGISVAGGGSFECARAGFFRRRVRAGGAASAHAVARGGGAARAG